MSHCKTCGALCDKTLGYCPEHIFDDGSAVWVVTDSEFNQEWYKDIIGGFYKIPPSYAGVREYVG